MIAHLDVAGAARVLRGEVYRGREVLAPGPGHSPRDRSLHVLFDPSAPDGFVVRSYAGEAFDVCRDYVKRELGLELGRRARARIAVSPPAPAQPDAAADRRRHAALEMWAEAVDPRGTPVEAYLASRGLELDPAISGRVLRYHARCPWKDEATGDLLRVPAMLAAMRDIGTDELRAVHRTRLTTDGRKVDRRWLGDATGTAIKLDPGEDVTAGLTLGEGIETVQSARQLGLRPAWATGSVSTLGVFPVLSGVEALTLLSESDAKGANARAIVKVGETWHAAGREVIVVDPPEGDVNDALRASLRIGRGP